LTINKIHERVIVEDGQIKAAKIMIANFVVDHRYLDGAKGKKMIPNFVKVFENLEAYSSKFKNEQANNSS
jgi:pyruvate/2-oxoglutarate dehydrogenase complex dihydrolipoamide acyltransferase (E2) component